MWSYDGPKAGWECIQWCEPVDPHCWNDNYLCYRGNAIHDFRFSCSAPIPGWNCVQIVEPADPHTWTDNYFCWKMKVIGNRIALRTANGQYVCAEAGGGREVIANRSTVGGWETFELISLGNSRIALRTANGQYVCAEAGGGREVIANRSAVGGWETFELIRVIKLTLPQRQLLCARQSIEVQEDSSCQDSVINALLICAPPVASTVGCTRSPSLACAIPSAIGMTKCYIEAKEAYETCKADIEEGIKPGGDIPTPTDDDTETDTGTDPDDDDTDPDDDDTDPDDDGTDPDGGE